MTIRGSRVVDVDAVASIATRLLMLDASFSQAPPSTSAPSELEEDGVIVTTFEVCLFRNIKERRKEGRKEEKERAGRQGKQERNDHRNPHHSGTDARTHLRTQTHTRTYTHTYTHAHVHGLARAAHEPAPAVPWKTVWSRRNHDPAADGHTCRPR